MNVNFLAIRESSLISDIETNFERLNESLRFVEAVVPEFIDASGGAVSRYLPNGDVVMIKRYFFCKTDVSVNAVTIYPFGSQLINAGASTALAAQGDKVTLAFDRASQSWWIIA